MGTIFKCALGFKGKKRVSPGNEVGNLLSSFFGQQVVDLRVQAVKNGCDNATSTQGGFCVQRF